MAEAGELNVCDVRGLSWYESGLPTHLHRMVDRVVERRRHTLNASFFRRSSADTPADGSCRSGSSPGAKVFCMPSRIFCWRNAWCCWSVVALCTGALVPRGLTMADVR